MVPIAIVGIVLAFLAVDIVIQYIQAMRGEVVYGFFMPDPPMETAPMPTKFSRMAASLNAFGVYPPSNVFLHDGHTWAAVEDSGSTRVGVSALARKAIGKIDALVLPDIGTTVRQGERLFAIRQGDRVAEFMAPVDGEVTHINNVVDLENSKDSLAWVCRVKPKNLSTNLGALRIAEDAVKWLYEELLRLQNMVAMQMPRLQMVGVTMQDGPLSLDRLLETLDDKTWDMFQKEFLKKSENMVEE